MTGAQSPPLSLLGDPVAASPRRRPGRRARLAAIVVALVLLAAGVTAWRVVVGSGSDSADDRAARASAQAFLQQWVDPDGRVVRRDQGNDSVSEGQAYGMLLAITAGDRTRFDQIWTWTKTHLQQPDSLLAWRWADGAVSDEQSAADADLDAIWALSLAGSRFGEPSATASAKTMAAAVLAQETVSTTSGRLLTAGPWARAEPATINPSYLVSGTAAALGRFTADREWDSLASATRTLDASVFEDQALPPDWATVTTGQPADQAQAVGAPGGGSGVQYGLDAPRLLIRLAASCSKSDQQLAASASSASVLGQPAIRSLSGQGQVDWQHPITDVAAAAVQAARFDHGATETALTAAQQLQTANPTYYGAAWVALGRTLLTTDILRDCHGS